MKRALAGALCALLLLGACRKAPPVVERVKEEPRPVVAAPPVPTRTYEEGYDTGFSRGKSQAAPKAALPSDEEVRRLAREEAAGNAERTERWQRGFAAGYSDGFRNVVTGQK